jgi:hypothetical protein
MHVAAVSAAGGGGGGGGAALVLLVCWQRRPTGPLRSKFMRASVSPMSRLLWHLRVQFDCRLTRSWPPRLPKLTFSNNNEAPISSSAALAVSTVCEVAITADDPLLYSNQAAVARNQTTLGRRNRRTYWQTSKAVQNSTRTALRVGLSNGARIM